MANDRNPPGEGARRRARSTPADSAGEKKKKSASDVISELTGVPEKKKGQARKPKIRLPHISFRSFMVAAVLVLILAALFMNNSSISVERITVSVPGLNKDLEGYTILHLSDLHGSSFGNDNSQLISTISALSYSCVVMTGDMVGADGNADPFFKLIEALPASRPIYFIAGDSDPGPLLTTPRDITGRIEDFVLEQWILDAEALGAIYLDAPASLTVGSATLWLTPGSMTNIDSSNELMRAELQEEDDRYVIDEFYDMLREGRTDEEVQRYVEENAEVVPDAFVNVYYSAYRLKKLTALQQSISVMRPEDMHVAVFHYPPSSAQIQSVKVMSETIDDDEPYYLREIDLALAGHYCGGVWKLPLYGAVYIPAIDYNLHGWFPAQEDVEGLKQVGNSYIHISGGLGATDKVWVPRFRLFNNPKITLLTLTGDIVEDY